MKKRKRESGDLPERTKPSVSVTNEKSDDFLLHVLHVSEFVTAKTIPNTTQLVSLDCILEALKEKKAMPGCPISKNDVCLLLLPWAVRNVLSGTNLTRSIWYTLLVSMDILVNFDHNHAKYSLSNQVLTQSTLFKLCPRVALFIASNKEEEDDDASFHVELEHSAKSCATKAYVILTEKLFHPTMDVACKSLLLPILEKETQVSSHYDMVLMATMNLIHRLVVHGKGNPKTTFQLIASAPILTALSKVYCYSRSRSTVDEHVSGQVLTLVKKIFSFGLFHPAHHLQGFYSLLHKTKTAPFSRDARVPRQKDNDDSSFRCYQEELLKTVEQSLSKNDTEFTEIVSIIHGVSLLFQVFLEQKLEERGDTLSKKKSQTLDPANMQFQMFARWVVRLQHLVENGVEAIRFAALQAILSMLESLLAHNAYSASQHDENGYFFNFLAGIYHQVSATTTVKTRKTGSLESIIPIFVVLLRLNHRLVHDSLERLVSCTLEVGVHGNEERAADLLVEAFSSYEKLRQQSYLVEAILKALALLRLKENDAETYLFLNLLRTERVRATASHALQSCPILIVKEIFSIFEEWFVFAVSKKDNEPQTARVCLYVAADVFEVLCQSIIVDKTTASHIAEMCEHFMEHAVSSFAIGMIGTTGSVNSALADISSSLCGGIIDLHIRCAFWLGRTNHIVIPSLLCEHLSNFRYLEPSKLSHFAGMFCGVALLACNRLTQIDTEIHEEERKTIESEDKMSDSDSLVAEGKALASSIFNLGSHVKYDEPGQYRHPYHFIARHRFQWLKYADDDHISLFLRWVCKDALVFTLDDSQKSAPKTSTFGKVDLFFDSSFVSHGVIYKRLFSEALAAAFDLIKLGLSTSDNADRDGVSDLLSVLDQPDNGQSLAVSLGHLQQKGMAVLIEVSDSRLPYLFRRASYLLREVAAPTIDSCDTFTDGKKLLHMLCKLDLAFRSLKFPSTLIISEWTATQFILRKVLSHLLNPFLSESLQTCLETRQQALETIERMFDSFATNEYLSLTSEETTASCGLELHVICIVGSLLASDAASDLATSLRNMTALATERRDVLALVAFSRFLAEGIRKYKIFNECPSRDVATYLEALWVVAKLRLRKDLLESSSSCWRLRSECMLLGCDLLRIEFDEKQYLELFNEITDDESILQDEDAAIDEYEYQSRVYVFGFLALTCTERSRCKRLLNAIIKQKKEHSLLDAAFMNVLIHIAADDIDELLERLIQREAPPVTLRYLLLCLQCATAEQTTAVAKNAHTIFILTMNLLNSSFRSQESRNMGLDTSLEIVDFLLNHREMIIFREFDIAVILSLLCAILGDCEQHTGSEVSVSTFSWCTTILTSMFQRYSKYLYACVPIVISLYFCVLKYAMFGPVDRKVSQQFAGVCDLMVAHKEVYKKHVLGIVLEFVSQVGFLSLEHRNRMLPAIYSLLDTMSTYEMQQLNASMGTEQKVLFRTIYQSYQKGHTHKGQ
ncbi:hypothetical protein FisN_1Lh099 [Fistulifera solaris]|uniref:Nucleolar 27S pre-rRNA processing Urb2/Npa2 C-terminal domain-containing protein n=1 Tax=Fistulifera solaris TaxID=1519565 RepID=A0A1Z5K593_FISSO|nr:hypothetical protein FisN_1Lh099 [Fistulifera solaris]|eukprot:GAX21271.1 hypothetical protein FisN_1Lh099 [Fistulifera solaris]